MFWFGQAKLALKMKTVAGESTDDGLHEPMEFVFFIADWFTDELTGGVNLWMSCIYMAACKQLEQLIRVFDD